MKNKLLALSTTLLSSSIYAGNYNIDARIEAMGGAGTAAGNYLSAGFYNPALLALEAEKTSGVIFPVIAVEYRDPEDLVSNMEDFGSIYTGFKNAPLDTNNRTNAANALRNIQDKVAYLSGGIGAAVAIPSTNVSGNFFVKGYTEGLVISEIANRDIDAIEAGTIPTIESKARILAFGIIDIGLALGSQFQISGQNIALGVTPKAQKIYSYHHEVGIDGFDLDDWDANENRTEDSVFNFDLGAAWERGPYRLGVVAKNLISHEITTAFKTRNYTYHVEPLYTVGSAFVSDVFTFSMDLDLNEQRRFTSTTGPLINDDTKFFRLGTEFNAWGQAQLRAGYIKDLEDNLKTAYTLGLGLSPLNILHLDLGVKLIDSNSYAGSLQLSFLF